MAKYINADELIQYIDDKFTFGDISREWHDAVEQELNWADPADVAEVKHGMWKARKNLLGEDVWECSECGGIGDYDNFCRICGADMRGKGNEN